jgi:translation elongation factor EF-1alpha
MTEEKKQVGSVIKFFGKVGVAAIELSATLKVGDKISIEGATTNFEQEVESMQVEKDSIQTANAGDAIGIKVKDKVRPGDKVFLA